MNELTAGQGQGLTAILICPDEELAAAFLQTAQPLAEISVVGRLADYPSGQVLEERVVSLQPDVVLLDMGSSREESQRLVSHIVDYWPQISAVGLSHSNEPDVILGCLRSGASEFLSSPFPAGDVQQALLRMLRRKSVEMRPASPARGSLLAFVPVKGGAGCTTLASSTAYRIHKAGRQRVLLVDFDLVSGLISFLFRINHPYSVIDAVKHSGQLDEALWSSLVCQRNGLDILAAPERPDPTPVDSYPVQEVLEYARSTYDYVVVDLGGVCDSVSLATLPMANSFYLVCSRDMPSLFLMRRAIQLLEETGYNPEQMRVLVNRSEKRPELSREDMEKIFRAPVHAFFADDAAAVSAALREGVPVGDNTDLGRSLGRFVKKFLGDQAPSPSKGPRVRTLRELLSGT